MIFVGHTRFSLFQPGSGAWQVSKGSRFESATEYRDHLYSDERMQVRARIFFQMALPQLARSAQGFDVRHIVSYSDTLPARYQQMLEDAAREYPFLVLDRCAARRSPLRPVDLVRKTVRRGESVTFATYRLDDDDVLPTDYFAQVAPYVTDTNAGMMVSLGAGATALYIDGDLYNIRRCYQPMIAIGLLNVCHISAAGEITEPKVIAHSRSDRANPVILDSRDIGFLWIRHVDQDTSVKIRPSREKTLERVREQMSIHAPVADLDELGESFAALGGMLHVEPSPGMYTQRLVGESTSITRDGLSCPFDPASGKFRLTARISGDAQVEPRSVLASLELTGPGGEPLDPETWTPRFRAIGISRSGNPAVGYYRYLNSRAGTWDTTFEAELPEGIVLRGVRLVKWRKGDYSVTADFLDVESEHVDRRPWPIAEETVAAPAGRRRRLLRFRR
jgi:hypothetical protein